MLIPCPRCQRAMAIGAICVCLCAWKVAADGGDHAPEKPIVRELQPRYAQSLTSSIAATQVNVFPVFAVARTS